MTTRNLKLPEMPLREDKPAAPKAKTPRAKPAPKAAAAPAQYDLVLPEIDDHAVRMVSFKIPVALYNDIDYLRSHAKLTATDIFVKSATPQVARLLAELKEREEQGAQ